MGSSHRSTFGSDASAMAMRTRWRMPPESWCGKAWARRSGSGMPTRRSSSTRAPPACGSRRPEHATGHLGHLGAHRVNRVEPAERILEDHGQPASPGAPGTRAGKRQGFAGQLDDTAFRPHAPRQ